MTELANIRENLPTAIEDLSKFVLVGREKLVAVRAEIRAIDKIGIAADVRRQKLEEAQAISEAVSDAETRIGEITAMMPKATPNNNQYHEITPASNLAKPKGKAIKELGFTANQVSQFEKMAKHPEIVEQAKAKAREREDIISRAFILQEIDKAENKLKREDVKSASVTPITGGIIHEGDLFDKIKLIPDTSIDLLFADPPYMILNEKWDEYQNLMQFMEFTLDWLDAVTPKVKPTGRVYISFSQYYQYDLYNLLHTRGFYGFKYGQTLIWNYRNNNKPSNRMMYRFAYEPVFYLYGKDAPPLNLPPESYGETQSNVWTIATPQSNFGEGKYHPAQKPVELLERIIMTGSKPGDTVLDPFGGSGTTAIAARKLGREYILIEKDPNYCSIARGRINGVD